MPQNTSPIFPLTPDIQWARLTASNVAFDGTGIVHTIFSSSASGSRVDYLKLRAVGTNTSSSLMRLFLNNGGDNSVARNNSMYYEQELPTTTSSSLAATSPEINIALNLSLPTAYRLNATLTVALSGSANAGWQATVVGGDY